MMPEGFEPQEFVFTIEGDKVMNLEKQKALYKLSKYYPYLSVKVIEYLLDTANDNGRQDLDHLRDTKGK